MQFHELFLNIKYPLADMLFMQVESDILFIM